MAKPFSEYTYDDAVEWFGQKPVISNGKNLTPTSETRRTSVAKAASQFYAGDHWQNSDGFIGQLPPASLPGAAQILEDIKNAFVSENVIQEVVETHTGGILGREPLWSYLPEEGKKQPTQQTTFEDTTGETVTPWWNEREALKDLQRCSDLLALEGIAVRRLFFPKGRVPENGILESPDLSTALDYIYFETHTSDVAGVFTDPDTQYQIGVFLFEEKDNEGNVTDNCAELSFLNEEGDTVCRIVKDKGSPEAFGPYKLGGRLLLHEMKRRPLITEQVQSSQKALNLAHTMMMRNVNMAGARERTVTNAQPPKKPKKIQNPNNPTATIETLEPGTYETGGGAVMFLMGYPVRNEKGDVVGYTNPNVSISDPAPVDVFKNTIEEQKTAIYSQCHQRHILISGDAMASGLSRKQAEKGYQRSLKETKTVLDAAGRWQLETTLRLAAQLTNESERYIPLRADFNCLLDIGEPEPDDRRIAKEMRDAKLISSETARNWIGIEDPAAELARIEEESATEPEVEEPVLTEEEDDREQLPA